MQLRGTLLGSVIVGTLLAVVLLGGFAWYTWEPEAPVAASVPAALKSRYKCDGRNRCDQLKSCEEAMFFVQNCPATGLLDEDKDGIPCEVQWCQR